MRHTNNQIMEASMNLSRSYIGILFAVVFSFFLSAGTALSTAASDQEFSVISTDQLKKMMDEKKEFILVDARTKEEYQEAHLVTAINVPEKQFEELVSTLPADKKSLLVFYCNGSKCGKSKRTAKKATALGYTNIAIYNEGFPVWEEKNLTIVAGPEYGKKIETTKLKPVEVKQMIDEKRDDYVLIDVRDAAEYKEGHIATAINIPAEIFASKQDILPKEKKIIVYCNTGSRSYMSYRKLGKMDYKNIYQTLFAEWKEAGFTVEK